MLLTFILIIISIPSPLTLPFLQILHTVAVFSYSGPTAWIPQTFTVTSDHIRFFTF